MSSIPLETWNRLCHRAKPQAGQDDPPTRTWTAGPPRRNSCSTPPGAVLSRRHPGDRRGRGGRARGRQQDEPVPAVFVEGRSRGRVSGAQGRSVLSAASKRASRSIRTSRPKQLVQDIDDLVGRASDAGLSRLSVRERRVRVSGSIASGAPVRRAQQAVSDAAAHRDCHGCRRGRSAALADSLALVVEGVYAASQTYGPGCGPMLAAPRVAALLVAAACQRRDALEPPREH